MASPLIGIGAQLVGGVMGAFGAEQSAGAQASSNYYQAALAAQNAQIQRQNAAFALQQGDINASQVGMAGRATLGNIRAGQAASGFNVNTGTQQAVQRSQEFLNQTNQTITRSNAAKRAYDFDVSALQSQEQSQLYQMAGKHAQAAGATNFVSSILGSATGVADKWTQMGMSGMSLTQFANPFGGSF